ncbi:endopeptidase [Paenibacillus sp. NAIST15-1]|nr:endopeptidase [Paenibacillus sp. NAIST15-1]
MPRGIEANVAPTIAIPPPRAECLALIPNANPIMFKIKDVIMTGFSLDVNMELYLITSFR